MRVDGFGVGVLRAWGFVSLGFRAQGLEVVDPSLRGVDLFRDALISAYCHGPDGGAEKARFSLD